MQVLDDRTLLIPDRRGNDRLDSLSNVRRSRRGADPFFIPGIGETLRVNGHATVVNDPGLLAMMSVRGKAPTTALKIDVAEAYLHCAKALIRSWLWQDDYRVERGDFPILGRILAEQADDGQDVAETDRDVEEHYRDKLY